MRIAGTKEGPFFFFCYLCWSCLCPEEEEAQRRIKEGTLELENVDRELGIGWFFNQTTLEIRVGRREGTSVARRFFPCGEGLRLDFVRLTSFTSCLIC